MKRVTGLLLGATVLTLGSVVSFAQQPQSDVVVRHQVVQGPDAPPPPPQGDIIFVASEMSFGGTVVKGAPYSAQAVTETIQTLGDGNRIVNRNSSAVYRDGDGRTRREINLKGLGNLGTGGEPFQSVFIHDPVAGVTYALDSKSHVAHKSAPFKIEWTAKEGGAPVAVAGQRFEMRVRTGNGPEVGVTTGPMTGVQIAPPPIGMGEPGQMTFKRDDGGSSYIFKRGPNPNEVKQELGKQLVEGIEAVGTRTTVTIPAGEIGNERAIEIVSERWYSEELQTVIMTRHSDPRNGETIYKLTNINRSEPAKSLFEVPAGYTVKEGPSTAPLAPGMRVKKLATPE